MKLFNTLGRQLQDFKPSHSKTVKLYTCGPTVYDFAQLGNLRSFVFDDTLRRALETKGYDVRHVMNVTDVGHLVSDDDEGEDKLEKGAARVGKTVWEVADYYLDEFITDANKLNILPPNNYGKKGLTYARATDFVAEQIGLVKLLLEKDFAYQTEQAIYFDVNKISDYGKLSSQNLQEKQVGSRAEVVVDPDKKSPADFALWFFATGRFHDHSMKWPSPWGEGFPGWHLECSAIIHATLGEPIDIHTGGVDHIGTHHTNEIAQSEAAYGTKLSRFWLHNEFLLVDGKKMSKSLGNFFTLADVIKKGYEPLALRLLFLQAHYRSQQNFTWDSLAAAQKNLTSLRAFADLRWQLKDGPEEIGEKYKDAWDAITQAIEEDLNTASALASLNDFIGGIEVIKPADADRHKAFITDIDRLFGLDLGESSDITSQQKELIEKREAARQQSDWQQADEIRNILLEDDIEINDTVNGPVWSRVR